VARSATDIQIDLDAAYAARREAMKPGYSLDTGQGHQSVTPANLSEINKTIKYLEAELASASDAIDGYTGYDNVSLQRHC